MIVKTIILPVTIQVSKNKRFPINLNHYRNAHYQTLNKAKQGFKDLVMKQLLSLPLLQRVKLVYRAFPNTAQELDVANICSIADKFFSDALVESGKIKDDNFKFVPEVSYEYGQVDRQNPRIEVEIHDLCSLTDDRLAAQLSPLIPPANPTPERCFTMKLVFEEEEILAALQGYVSKIMNLSPDSKPEIQIAASPEGTLQASMMISATDVRPVVTTGYRSPSIPQASSLGSEPQVQASSGSTRDAVREALKEPSKARKTAKIEAPVADTMEPETSQPEPAENVGEAPAQQPAKEEVVSLLKTKPVIAEPKIAIPAITTTKKVETVVNEPAAEPAEEKAATPSLFTKPATPAQIPALNISSGSEEREDPENPSSEPEEKTGTEPAQPVEKPRPTLGISIGTKKQEPSPAPVEENTPATEQEDTPSTTNIGGNLTEPKPMSSIFNFKKTS